VDITVIAIGTSATSSVDKFTYVAAPSVSGFSPSFGPPAGGTTGITITGTGFYGGGSSSAVTAVYFGSIAAASYTVTSDKQITATSPAGSGLVDVTVTTQYDTSTTSSADRFSYIVTAGPNNARTGADGGGSGSPWSSPSNITADDTSYATSSFSSRGGSHYLYGTNYGFNIPSGATIVGIQVTIMRQSSGTSLTDNIVQLLKGGSRVGSDYSSSTSWPTSMTAVNYGGSSDLWGTTWTPAQINNSNFGVALSVSESTNSSRTASVDYMQITVYYMP
jgi:hypothetical protein